MKRVRPNWAYRFKAGLKPAGKTLFATVGTAGTLTGIASAAGFVLSIPALIGIGVLCAGSAGSVLLIKSRSKHLPDIVLDEDGPDGRYTAEYCDAESLREANRLTKPYYRDEYVSDEIAEAWRKKTPRGFVALRNGKGQLCAAFGVIAMEESFFVQFVKGRVRDNDLESDDILDSETARKSRDLYISGVVVKDPDSTLGRHRACVMVWAMVMYLKKVYGIRRKRNIFALAVSRQSKNILRRFGFAVISPADKRLDKLDLYQMEWNKEVIKRILQRVGDHSPKCDPKY